MTNALDRDALYYPYIHISDINWLKATLLCFPQVRRIMPAGFEVEDPPQIREFRETIGPRDAPLLVEEYPDNNDDWSSVRPAQERLLSVLQSNKELIQRMYSLTPSPIVYAEPKFADPLGRSYRIHTGKLMDELATYLANNQLAAFTTKPKSYIEDQGQWVFVHNKLGEAIMSVLAIAIARHKGLDIVTDSGTIHHALAVLDESEVFAQLAGVPGTSKETSAAEKVDEIAQIVMTSFFDMSKLGAKQIADLTNNGHDLRTFKNALVPIAESLPEIHEVKERERRLKQAAAQVMDQWKKYKKSLPRFALDALTEATEVRYPELAAAIALGGTGVTLGLGAGLAIGLLTWKGLAIWRKFKERTATPYSYLSKIEAAGATLVLPPAAKT